MLLQPYDPFVLGWLVIAAASACYVAWDQFRGNPEPAVMKWGFVLVTLYMGPIGLLLYVMADKEPRPGTHEAFTKPLWKQAVGSTVHCVAGDATGIILAAVIAALFGLPMWMDLMIEYVAGFAFGLFIFQALFMKGVMGGSYWANVRRSFLPEFISMNAMMAGMAPVMAFLMMGRDMRAMWPGEPLFWLVMSLGVTVGFAVAYPVNAWLVHSGLKHGLMTVRPTRTTAGHPHGPHHGATHADTRNPHEHAAASTVSHDGHAARHAPAFDAAHQVTRAQLTTVTAFTLLMLATGLTLPGAFVNLSLGAHDVGRAIMPPGMIMTRGTSAEAMREMAAVDPRLTRSVAAPHAHGDRVLPPDRQGPLKVFHLEASVIRWSILPDTHVRAYAINAQVPGPRLEVQEGDRVRINFVNHLPESTSLHWHGLVLPNDMDGAAHITQDPIAPGQRHQYEFTASRAGTYFYHSHEHTDRQQGLGLYGALIVRPVRTTSQPAQPDRPLFSARQPEPRADLEYTVQLQEWLVRDGLTYPAMPMEGAFPNYFTINGKSYPATPTLRVRLGQRVRIRFIGSHNSFIHPMHVHGGPFEVVARDGETLPPAARFLADTVNVAPGQRYDVIWTARRVGKWLLHCHIPHHMTNDNTESHGGGGLMMIIDVTDDPSPPAPDPAAGHS